MLQLDQAREKMHEAGMDALIAASVGNLFYATGYYSEWASLIKEHIRMAVIPAKPSIEPFVIAADCDADDFRKHCQFSQVLEFPTEVYVRFGTGDDNTRKRARRNVKDLDLSSLNGAALPDALARVPSLLLAKALKDRGLGSARIGIDQRNLAYKVYCEIEKALPYAQLIDATDLFGQMRSIKTPEEIETIRQATKRTQKAVQAGIDMAGEGVDLWAIIKKVKQVMTDFHTSPAEVGVEAVGMAGWHPEKHALKKGDVFCLDLGARYKWYCSDVSRVVSIGKPKKEYARLYDALVEAEARAIDKIKPGARCADLLDTAEKIVRKVDPEFTRGHVGHGVGIDLHEKPYVRRDPHGILKPGMVITIEIPYYFGPTESPFNLEDVLLVTEKGHEYLTEPLSREFFVK